MQGYSRAVNLRGWLLPSHALWRAVFYYKKGKSDQTTYATLLINLISGPPDLAGSRMDGTDV